ncbi:ketoacyl-ACP synthase III [Helicobacter muridarum]|uniref:Beta-ketoacyl-[acyl-carrier-protein] synthase III n=1 Tax=Helicobacter muridarum TaxID=216 RepID=A0A099TYU9_9HELI|nr:beta-ketoacyl-ACP synthase III [Helicobacter muridarum]TLE00893.1 ketoacyl-ACP synthase III [Helicobacter muridarum]STQ86667.1 3-oxoacyl-ACP synthase [Helicobacter muridarum]
MSVYASMKSIASYVPSRCVPNKFFTSFLETSDEWIVQRTGINTRYFAPSHLKSSDLGVEAAKLAIKRANLSSSDIDIILCASISPDFFGMPSTACIIASKLGMKDIPAFDITAACSGFVYCLSMAKSYIESGAYNNVLVVGAEKISSILDFTDRSTCVLFGDGAGACVIGQGDKVGIKDVHISSNGDFSHLLYTPKSNNMPNNFQSDISILDGIIEEKETENQFLRMKGNEVFKVAVRTISKDAKYMLQKHNILPNELDYFVPHQANLRIIQAIANSLELPDEKIVLTVQKYGNTSAASIPMALDFAYTHGMFKNRDLLLLDAFGAGFTWGSALVYADFAD